MPSSNTQQTVTVAIDVGEILESRQYKVLRKQIDRGGAPGVFDGTGSATIRVNNAALLLIHLRENDLGHAALEVFGLSPSSAPKALAMIDLEVYGIVPARPTKERTS